MPRPRGRQGNVRTASVLKAWATVQRPRKASRETGRRGWLAQGRQQGFPRKKFQLPAPVCTLCRCFRGSNRTFSAVCNVQTKGKPPPSLFLSFLPSFLVVVVVVATPRPNPFSRSSLVSSCEVSRAEIAAIVPPKCFIAVVRASSWQTRRWLCFWSSIDIARVKDRMDEICRVANDRCHWTMMDCCVVFFETEAVETVENCKHTFLVWTKYQNN